MQLHRACTPYSIKLKALNESFGWNEDNVTMIWIFTTKNICVD